MQLYNKNKEKKFGISSADKKKQLESMELLYRQFILQAEEPDEECFHSCQISIKPRFIFPAYSHHMIKFDFLICACTFYDCFYIPMSLTFGERLYSEWGKVWLTTIAVFIKLVYTADIIINFRRGFVNPRTGIEEKDLKSIAINYIKFFFWIDLLAALPFNFISDLKFLSLT